MHRPSNTLFYTTILLCEKINQHELLQYLPTVEMWANFFTIFLPKSKHIAC